MAQQAVEHAGQTTEDARPAEQILREIGDQPEQQRQRQQHWRTLTSLDAPAQLPVPHAVHGQVKDAEVHEDRRDQPPPLAGREALLQRGEVGVLAVDAKVDEVQPADRGKVLAEQGDPRHRQGDQQHRRGKRAGTQGSDEAAAPPGLFDHHAVVALGVARIQVAHLLDHLARHPQHLLVALLRDPARHPQATQQGDEAAEVFRQRQAQGLAHRTHRNTACTSTQANLVGSRRVSWSSR